MTLRWPWVAITLAAGIGGYAAYWVTDWALDRGEDRLVTYLSTDDLVPTWWDLVDKRPLVVGVVVFVAVWVALYLAVRRFAGRPAC